MNRRPILARHAVRATTVAWLVLMIYFFAAVPAVTQTEAEWLADQIIVTFEAPFEPSALDTLYAHYPCIAHQSLTESIYLLTLQTGADEAGVAEGINVTPPFGVKSACLNLLGKTAPSQTRPMSDVPDALEFNCPRVAADQLSMEQWPLGPRLLNVCRAWEVTTGDPSVVIVSVDCGVNIYHPDIDGTIRPISGVSFVDNLPVDDNPNDRDGWHTDRSVSSHGTGMVGLMWAKHNNGGLAGIAPDAEMRVCKVAYQVPSHSECTAPLSSFLEALSQISLWARTPPGNEKNFVVQISIGYTSGFESPETAAILQAMKGEFTDRGLTNVLFVCATGNDNDWIHTPIEPPPDPPPPEEPGRYIYGYVDFPAGLSGSGEAHGNPLYYATAVDEICVAVGSMTVSSEFGTDPCPAVKDWSNIGAAFYANWASRDTCEMVVDMAAPGGGSKKAIDSSLGYDVPVLTAAGGYGGSDGTSIAAAEVAGLAALAWSVAPDRHAKEIKAALRQFSKPYEGRCRWDFYYPIHRNHGFSEAAWEAYCPQPSEIADPPVIGPGGAGAYKADGSINFDARSSVVAGSGMPDASELVSFIGQGGHYHRVWGGVLAESLVLENVGTLMVLGDLVIPDGVTLTVNAASSEETVDFVFLGGDLVELQGERAPDLCEITVLAGGALRTNARALTARAAPGALDPTACWYGIVVEPGGVLASENNEFELDLAGCTDCLEVDSYSGAKVTLTAAARGLTVSGEVDLEELTISTGEVGCWLSGHGSLTLTGPSAHALAGPGHGVGVVFDCTGNSAVVVTAGALTISGFDYGIDITSSTYATVRGDIRIIGSAINGMRIRGSHFVDVGPSGGAPRIEGGVQDGIHLYNSTGVILSGLTLANVGQKGIACWGASSLECTDTLFEGNGTACFVRDSGTANLGDTGALGPGNNRFVASRRWDIVSFNEETVVTADYNLWWCGGAPCCPPPPSKIMGWVETLCNP